MLAAYDYRPAHPQDYELVRRFLAENGWAHRVADPDRFAKMMQGSNRAVVAWEGERIIGFGRALCDEVSNGYFSMVAVAEDKQGQGVGRKVVQWLVENDPDIMWVLRAGRGSEGFWRKMGFAVSESAMERTRQPKPAVRLEAERASYEAENPSSELYRQARKAMDAGQVETAAELFQQSINAEPHFKSLELLGQCLIMLGRTQEAIVPLAAATTLNNGDCAAGSSDYAQQRRPCAGSAGRGLLGTGSKDGRRAVGRDRAGTGPEQQKGKTGQGEIEQ